MSGRLLEALEGLRAQMVRSVGEMDAAIAWLRVQGPGDGTNGKGGRSRRDPMLAVMHREPSRSWSAQEMHRALEADGVSFADVTATLQACWPRRSARAC